MAEGPTTYTIKKTTCLGCKYHVNQLRISGKNPIRDHYCLHPKTIEEHKLQGKNILFFERQDAFRIGTEPDTPSWCPYLSDIKK